MYGITSFSAVINPPQACILAVGAGIQRVLPPLPGASPARPRVVTTVTVQLSADRRVVDEATAAQFLQVSVGAWRRVLVYHLSRRRSISSVLLHINMFSLLRVERYVLSAVLLPEFVI